MKPLLKLAVLLLCVQTGDGLRMKTLIDKKVEGSAPHVQQSPEEASGSGASAAPAPPRRRRSAPPPTAPCGLRSVLLRVRELGLGYDSDESVLFKYCGGACPRARSNHDLALAYLLLSGLLPPPPSSPPSPPPGQPWHGAACCRPTHHEDMAFLDNTHRWHKVEKLSAAGCSCVG